MSQNNKKNQKFVGVIGISDFINLIEENKKLKERIEELKEYKEYKKLKERIEELKKDNSCKNCGRERIGCDKDCFQSKSDEDVCDWCVPYWFHSNRDEC